MNLLARFLPGTVRAALCRSHRNLPLVIVFLFLGWASVATAGNGDLTEPVVTEPVVTEPVVTEPVVDDGWEFSFMLYGWLTWIELEATTGTGVDFGGDQILDKLNMTAQFQLEVRKRRWGLSTDVIYLRMNSDLEGQLLNNLKLEGWIVTPQLSYRVWEGKKGHLDLQAGARYYRLDLELEAAGPLGESSSHDIWDGVIGVRANYNLTERWYLPLLADVGTGDSDFQTQIYAGLGYRFKHIDVSLAFRLLYYDFPSGIPLKDQLAYGPILGFKVTF